MRVLVVTHNYPPREGGITTHVVEVGRHLARRGDTVRFLVPPLGDDLPVVDGCDVRALWPVDGPWTRLAATTWGVLTQSHRWAPDVIYSSHWRNTGVATWLARMLASVSFVQAVHGTEITALVDGSAGWPFRVAFDRVVRDAAGIIALGQTQTRMLRDLGVPEDRILTSPEGVHVERFTTPPRERISELQSRLDLGDGPVLLTVGRVVPRKGHDTVIRALPAVARAHPDVCYLVVGRGPEEDRLRWLAKEYGVAKHVTFAGFLEDDEVVAAYHLADLLVLPNRKVNGDIEGFGIAVLEAGACGKPAVVGDQHGPAEIVVDGETGRLIDSTDPDAVAEAIADLLAYPDCLAEMGKRARRRVLARYNYEQVVAGIREFMIESIR